MLNEFEQQLLESLFLSYYWDLQKTAFRIVRDQDDAQDVVQTVFTNIAHNPKGIMSRDQAGRVAYLYYAVKAEAFRFLKKRSRNLAAVLELQYYYTDTRSPEVDFDLKAESLSLGALSVQDKDLLAYRYILGYSYKEIADITGIKFTSVGSRIRETRKRAKRLLQEGGYYEKE